MFEDVGQFPLVRLRRRYQTLYDGVSMLLYLGVVYVWSLTLYPLGGDYALLHGAGAGLPPLTRQLFSWEVAAFGNSPVGYHLVNLGLLYGCMVAVYAIAAFGFPLKRRWLALVAATLFMANPVHSGSVLALAGVASLVPALLGLAALAAYTLHTARPRPWRFGLALALFAVAALPFKANVGLVVVVVLWETIAIHPKGMSSVIRLTPFVVLGLVSFVLHASGMTWAGLSPAGMLAPLYFIFYPIGFLPETARNFHAEPWLGWLAAGVVLVVLFLAHRKIRRGAFLFGLCAMAASRLFQGQDPVDPVHLVGGGQLLMATALFSLALAVLFSRIMDHPKWQRSVISFSTILCLVLFGIQIRGIGAWRHAGEQVRAFQTKASQITGADALNPLGVLPDYRYYRGAPLCLSDSIAYDTPFSRAVPHEVLLALHYDSSQKLQVRVERVDAGEVWVWVEHDDVLGMVPWPYVLAWPDGELKTGGMGIEVLELTDSLLRLSVRSEAGELPAVILPADEDAASAGLDAASAGEESGGEAQSDADGQGDDGEDEGSGDDGQSP